jgi:hypothetical protein
MLCRNRITIIGFVGQGAETRMTPNSNRYTRVSVTTNATWKENGRCEYKTSDRVASRDLLEHWQIGLAICTKSAYVGSKANSAIAHTHQLNSIAAPESQRPI